MLIIRAADLMSSHRNRNKVNEDGALLRED
jgi:hypothetical protein